MNRQGEGDRADCGVRSILIEIEEEVGVYIRSRGAIRRANGLGGLACLSLRMAVDVVNVCEADPDW